MNCPSTLGDHHGHRFNPPSESADPVMVTSAAKVKPSPLENTVAEARLLSASRQM